MKLPTLWRSFKEAGTHGGEFRATARSHSGAPCRGAGDEERGIIIPDTAKDKPQEGEVLSVGKGKINEDGKVLPLDVKPGNRILFGKYAGTEINFDGEEYLIMREDEVLGILAKVGKRAKVAA